MLQREKCFVSILTNLKCCRRISVGEPKFCDVDSDTKDHRSIRDISRLTRTQKNVMRGALSSRLVNSTIYLRKMWGTYGQSSNINPAIAWPTRSELQKNIEFEKQWVPSLNTLMTELKNRKINEEKDLSDRLQTVEKCMQKMPQLLKQYENKQQEKLNEELKRDRKRQQLLEEARDFFGYEVDPRDDKFQEMVEKKEKEEKQAEKQRKREQKLAKMMAKYQEAVSQKPSVPITSENSAKNDDT